jgi:hypothetical protein
VPDRLLVLLSEESVSLPTDRAVELVHRLLPVPGALRARATIERALSTRASALSLDRLEKQALLIALNTWMDAAGFEELGPDLIDLRGALEYDLGEREQRSPTA